MLTSSPFRVRRKKDSYRVTVEWRHLGLELGVLVGLWFAFLHYAEPSFANMLGFHDALLLLVLYKLHRLLADIDPDTRHPAVDLAVLGLAWVFYERHAAKNAPHMSFTLAIVAYILWQLQRLQSALFQIAEENE